MNTVEPKLTEIGLEESDRRASSKKFRVVTIVDSCPYQVGDETYSIDEARELCRQVPNGHFTQVFDDQGQRYVFAKDPVPTKPALREIGTEERFAGRGMFRAVMFIDSCPYHIGEDVETVEAARRLYEEARKGDEPFQVYDDEGNRCIN